MISHFSRFVNPFCGKRQIRIPQGIRPHHADARILALRNAPRSQKERDSRTRQNPTPPQNTKNFPHVPATSKKRNKIPLRKWRGHGGSSRKVREAWRERNPSFKRGSSPSKVFSPQGLSSKVFLSLHPAHRGADFGLQLFAALGRNVGIPVFRQKRGNAQLRMAENRRVFRQLPLFQLS